MVKFNGLKLKKSKETIKETFRLEIEGDENDADYKREVTEYNNYDELKPYLTLISKIGREITSNGGQNRDDYTPSDSESDLMYDICPYSDHGMHDLNVTEFVYFNKDGTKFDIDFEPEFYL